MGCWCMRYSLKLAIFRRFLPPSLMVIQRLVLSQFRCHQHCSWQPSLGVNVVLGANASGKTSLLEAIHLMSYGKSFRCRLSDELIQHGANAFDIFVEWSEPAAGGGIQQRRAGFHYGRPAWVAKVDGQIVSQIGQMCAALRVITFEPGSHALVHGSSSMRRRYLDWGLFHVELGFWATWRRYARALRHRNSLLKQDATGPLLEAWDQELAQTGEMLTAMREQYLNRLHTRLMTVAEAIAPRLGLTSITFSPGWKRQSYSLIEALYRARERDTQLGYTTIGPHRADWFPSFANGLGSQELSRGQAKLVALSCLLAQGDDLARHCGQWPVMMLDDVASELDSDHQMLLLQWLKHSSAQVLITLTDHPLWRENAKAACTWFHVKHGSAVIERVT